MKTISAPVLVALMTTAMGFVAVAPAYAQAEPAPAADPAAPGGAPAAPSPAAPATPAEAAPLAKTVGEMSSRHSGPSGFLTLDRGPEAVELALVRLSYALELTAEQQPLFDAFETAAIQAATDYAATMDAQPDDGTQPDPSTWLDTQIAVQSARLNALQSIAPSATALFESLSETQLGLLTPQRPDRPNLGNNGNRPGFGHPAQHPGMGNGPMPRG
jgi:hypothetical protein